MNISILSIGNEILDGRVQDTNSNYFARKFSDVGIELNLILTCGDSIHEIVKALEYLAPKSDIIITTGGLGPTTDDLTREAIAEFIKVPLIQDLDSLKRLEEKFISRKRVFNTENLKQAYFPKDSKIIKNYKGTADGFSIYANNLTIYSVPGVPGELFEMFENDILPSISSNKLIHKRSMRIFGLPESYVGKQIRELSLPSDIIVSYRASMPEIEVILKSDSTKSEKTYEDIYRAIGSEFIFAIDQSITFPEYVAKLLIERNLTVSVAESCTGGMLGSYLTSTAGISNAFIGGVISYSNSVKETILNVSRDILKNYGAVSGECASSMASGCISKFRSDYSISITGIAGPDGGSQEKPVGTFFIGLADSGGVTSRKFFFNSNRAAIRKYAVYVALDVLRRKILNLSDWNYFEAAA